MWWLLYILVPVLAFAVIYGWQIKDSIKLSPKVGCNSCPNKTNEN